MAFGFLAIGDSGAVQIDENYSNLLLRQKGTAVTSLAIGNVGCRYVDITFNNCVSPVVALQCFDANRQVTVVLVGRTGSDWTFRFISAIISGTTTSASATINYFLFDTGLSASSAAFGLRVYKADGALSFDSGNLPLRVIDFAKISWGVAGIPPTSETRDYSVGSAAFIPSRTGNRGVREPLSGSSADRFFFSAGQNVDSNSIYLGAGITQVDIKSGSPPAIGNYPTDPDWLIADVTNY